MKEGSLRWALGDGGVWEGRGRWKVCLEEAWPRWTLGDTEKSGPHREQPGPRAEFTLKEESYKTSQVLRGRRLQWTLSGGTGQRGPSGCREIREEPARTAEWCCAQPPVSSPLQAQCLEPHEQVGTLLSRTWLSKMLNNSSYTSRQNKVLPPLHLHGSSFPENPIDCQNPCLYYINQN